MYSVPKVFIPATPIIPMNKAHWEFLPHIYTHLLGSGSYFSMINSIRKDTMTNIPQYLCTNKDQNATADKINQGYSSLNTLYWNNSRPIPTSKLKSRNRIRHTTADTIKPGSNSRIIIYRLHKEFVEFERISLHWFVRASTRFARHPPFKVITVTSP